MPNALPSSARLEFVVAASDNGVIGRSNSLPWHLPDDLKRFKSLTLGKPILMGRKTYQSIGKALPGRLNIVMSRSKDFASSDALVVSDLDQARRAAGEAGVLMVIGGSEIYAQALAEASRIHLTLVHTRIEDGDAFFDGWRQPQWQQRGIEYHAADARHAYAFSFLTLDRA